MVSFINYRKCFKQELFHFVTKQNRKCSKMFRWIAGIQEWFLSLNLFIDGSTDDETIKKQKQSSRLFLVSLIASVILLVLYSSLEIHKDLFTIQNPSYDTFSSLKQKYSDILSCPCSNTVVNLTKYIQVDYILHQVRIRGSIHIQLDRGK